MKLMIASDLHGSNYYVKKLMERFREEAPDKILHQVMKVLSNLGIEGNFLSLIKDIYRNTTTTVILNGERLNAFPLRSRVR